MARRNPVRGKGGRFAYTGGPGSQGGRKPGGGGRSRTLKGTGANTAIRGGTSRTQKKTFTDMGGVSGRTVNASMRGVTRTMDASTGRSSSQRGRLSQTSNVIKVGKRPGSLTSGGARRASRAIGTPISRSGNVRYVSRTAATLGGSSVSTRGRLGSAHSARAGRRRVKSGYIVNRGDVRFTPRS